ncbi:outer membrane receptor protein involved in Fe transport [Lewinella aquimaris]|uniref:Outer membrane receptor protein involved in Fe transport n=1 Tax=Neolewinella aquimaris TaxID=1835722 RepID=A0A840E512_9BACT|nr:outer membrane beta-barrel family protein [Neolewinella aquimaris]MBB4078822.1 outer membrane receptor protein involved in Fe transport [Neolewinella aquimaris]
MPQSLLILLLLAGVSLPGQDILLTGSLVQDGNGEPLGFATAVAYSAADSSMQGNATTEVDGSFTLSLGPGSYYLVFQFLGFDNKVIRGIEIAPTDGAIDVGTVRMTQSGLALETVEVTTERSQMVMKLDKRVFNVGKDLTGAGNTAADILNNVPSVNVDPEGNVSLRGSNGVRILVDGKPSAMLSSGDLDALRRMQGDIIESVEVITNPSARYEAEGEAGIINIILKKNRQRGINGSFGATVGYPDNLGASYSLNYRRDQFNLFSNFGISYRRSPGGGTDRQQFLNDDGSLLARYDSETDQNRGGIGGNFQLGTDWFINDHNQLTGSLLYRQSKDDNIATVTYRDFGESGQLISTTVRDTEEDSDNQNLESSLSYKRTFDGNEDRVWTIDAQYILDDDIELSDISQTTTDRSGPLLQKASNTEYETNLLLQTDYVHPFSDSLKIEGGLRSTFRTIRNAFRVEEADENGTFVVFPQFDDELEYNENIAAAYFIGNGEFGPLGVQVGLRGELSDVTAALLKSEVTNEQKYFNLFPSASVSYRFSELSQFQVSYSRRLSRPFFRLLLPFSNFNNPRNNTVGNPTLRPEYTDSYEAGMLRYLPRGSVLASLYYRYTTGVIERLTLPAADGTTIRFPVNLGDRNAYGVELNVSYDLTEWWKVTSDFNLYTATVEGNYQEIDYAVDITSWNGRAATTLDLSDRLQTQVTFEYDAPQNTPQGRNLASYALDVGASLDVLRGKGTITLSGRDLFNTRISRTVIDQPTYRSESDFQWRQARQVVLSFVYRLNQEKRRTENPDGE